MSTLYRPGHFTITGQCELCDRITKLVRDHHHECGIIRGYLCNVCNRIIGRHEQGWAEYRNPSQRVTEYLKNCGCNRKEVA